MKYALHTNINIIQKMALFCSTECGTMLEHRNHRKAIEMTFPAIILDTMMGEKKAGWKLFIYFFQLKRRENFELCRTWNVEQFPLKCLYFIVQFVFYRTIVFLAKLYCGMSIDRTHIQALGAEILTKLHIEWKDDPIIIVINNRYKGLYPYIYRL